MNKPSARRLAVLLGVVALGACGTTPTGPDPVLVEWAGAASETHTIAVGQEIDFKLGTVGAGQYDSLPALSSSAITFLDAAFVAPNVPAGPRQLFRFRAERPGTTVVTFHHTGDQAAVTSTVVVE